MKIKNSNLKMDFKFSDDAISFLKMKIHIHKKKLAV